MTKKKTLADAGKEPQTIREYEQWQLATNEKIVNLGQKLERQGIDICQLLSEINIGKQLEETLSDINDGVRNIHIKTSWRVVLLGMVGGMITVALIFLGLWFYFGGL
jgi:hypothetical protein